MIVLNSDIAVFLMAWEAINEAESLMLLHWQAMIDRDFTIQNRWRLCLDAVTRTQHVFEIRVHIIAVHIRLRLLRGQFFGILFLLLH